MDYPPPHRIVVDNTYVLIASYPTCQRLTQVYTAWALLSLESYVQLGPF